MKLASYWLAWVEIDPKTDRAINEWGKPFRTYDDAVECVNELVCKDYVGKIIIIAPDNTLAFKWSKSSLRKANWCWFADYELEVKS